MNKKKTNKEELRVSFLPDRNAADRFKIISARVLIWVTIALVVFILGVSGFLRIKAGSLEKNNENLNKKIEEVATEISNINQNLSAVGNIGSVIGFAKDALDKHVASEQVLRMLETSTIPEVYFKQIAADTQGDSLVVLARALNSEGVSRQVLAWESDSNIKKVDISGISASFGTLGNIEGVDFTATIAFDPKVIKWQP